MNFGWVLTLFDVSGRRQRKRRLLVSKWRVMARDIACQVWTELQENPSERIADISIRSLLEQHPDFATLKQSMNGERLKAIFSGKMISTSLLLPGPLHDIFEEINTIERRWRLA